MQIKATTVAATCVALLAAGFVTGRASAEEPRRQLGPHVHGEAHLSIAIDGGRLEMEFTAPGDDIVGFEHAPSTDAQKAALADAQARLGQIATLATLPTAAGCRQTGADVKTIGALGGAALAKPAVGAKPATGAEPEQHGEFRVTYTLECGAPGDLKSIAFGYFKAFPKADKLEITVIGPKGQTSTVLEPAKTVLDLGGIT